MLGQLEKKQLQQKLLSWYENYKRDFPWRHTSNPYNIIIAEKLLQQTIARDSVVTAYEELITKYPLPSDLAIADIKELENIIRPLGLLYRAHELKTMARELAERHNDQVPNSLNELLALTGIGSYCARAVLSFAYGQSVSIVDSNVARFLYRLYGIDGAIPANPARSKRIISLATDLLPPDKGRDFNLAILDLCSKICRLSSPSCTECPILCYCAYGIRSD